MSLINMFFSRAALTNISNASIVNPFGWQLLTVAMCTFTPAMVHGQILEVPATNTTGSYTIRWSGGGNQVYLEEESPSGWTTIAVGGGSSNGVLITKTMSGTYNYTLKNCIWNGRGMSCNPTGITKSVSVILSGSPIGSNYVTSYTYDELGRLKTAIHPNNIKDGYSYDSADNRIEKTTIQN